ncbi:MAG TPA: hypothetical protein VMB52_04945 [Verrucomicrobiae bacterium]|nr:hypothetical protein [Verrucomicrobiae bacterium]
MDTNNTSPQGPVSQPNPGVPHRPVQPMARRPIVDGFAPRRPLQTGNTLGAQPHQLRPHPTGQSVQPHHPHQQVSPQPPVHIGVHTPMATSPAQHHQPHTQPVHATAGRPVQSGYLAAPRPGTSTPTHIQLRSDVSLDEQATSTAHPPREKSSTGHAGLAGLGAFFVLSVLLLVPLLPGKIVQNFPLSSSSFSTGDESLGCLTTPSNQSSSTKYNTKTGFPITYTYSTTTTQTATCDGQTQSATTGRTSQFNPLGLIVDVVVALVVAILISRVWRLIFGEKKHTRERKD